MADAAQTAAPQVVIVTSRLDIGGTERHLTRILPALKRRGIDIVLYVMERGGPLEAGLIDGGIRVEGPQPARFLHWPRATLALARFLQRERPAVVHFFLPRPYVYGSIAAELARHRRRVMSRRSLTDYRSRYPLLGSLERLLHRRTAALLGNSQAVVEQLTNEVDDPRKLALIHNGIELPKPVGVAERQRIRDMLSVAADTLVIAAVANLVAYKGHRDLIAALARVNASLPSWRLLAVGRDDGIGLELKRQAEELEIAERILWLGERPDVGDLLAASDIFVLPSHQEGFSNALLEAMAAPVAPIATAIGGNVDAVTDNKTGLLVAPGDPASLAAAILRLANDPALRRSLADAARLRVRHSFTLDACVGRYAKLYRAISEPNPKPIGEILLDEADTGCPGKVAAALEHAP